MIYNVLWFIHSLFPFYNLEHGLETLNVWAFGLAQCEIAYGCISDLFILLASIDHHPPLIFVYCLLSVMGVIKEAELNSHCVEPSSSWRA